MSKSTHSKAQRVSPILKYLPFVERILLGILAVALILVAVNVDVTVAKVSIILLGVTYFLMAYRPSDIPVKDDEQFGMQELLGLLIVPKILWISCAVSCFGISLFLSRFTDVQYKGILLIGAATAVVATLVLVILALRGVKHINMVMPVLLRVIPLLAADVYISLYLA
jgi:hypothetical protein